MGDTPEELYEELDRELHAEMDKLQHKNMDPAFFAAIERILKETVDRVCAEYGHNTVLLPCGHTADLQSLKITTSQDRDIINFIYECPTCARAEKRIDDLRLTITMDLVNKISYLSLNETEKVQIDSLTLYAKAGKSLYRVWQDGELAKKDRMGVCVKVDMEETER